MGEHVDAIVVGMGPGGEVVAGRLLAAGRRVAVVESELIGGECAYWACVPSKSVLRPPEAADEVARSAGVEGARLDWLAARDHRDYMVRHLDDAAQVAGYADRGGLVVKGRATVTGPRRVRVGDRELTADDVIVATGSAPDIPPIEGLDTVVVWTNRETYSARELPGRAVIVGGSAVGIETAWFLARFGVATTVVEVCDRLLAAEEPRVGEIAARHLGEAGVAVRTGTAPQRARRRGADTVLDLDGGEVAGDVVVLATGRSPRTAGLGLESAGVALGDRGEVLVDASCRAAEGMWAVGDVTGIMLFTHVAKYQGRVIADTILGTPRAARYEGIPRVVFAEPDIAAVGLTRRQAGEQGVRTAAAEIDLADAITRPWTYETHPRGHLGLVADADREVLVGAWAVAPHAGEWIHQAALAVRESLPIEVLLDQVPQFPTYTEGYLSALNALSVGSTARATRS